MQFYPSYSSDEGGDDDGGSGRGGGGDGKGRGGGDGRRGSVALRRKRESKPKSKTSAITNEKLENEVATLACLLCVYSYII